MSAPARENEPVWPPSGRGETGWSPDTQPGAPAADQGAFSRHAQSLEAIWVPG